MEFFNNLCTVDDVRRLYEYGGVRLTSCGVEALRKILKTPQSGRHRTCFHVVAALHTSQETRDKGFIDSGLIIRAIKYLDLPFKLRLPVAVIRADIKGAARQNVSVAG